MISPHAQALYDRLLKKGIDGNSALPEAGFPGAIESKSHEAEESPMHELGESKRFEKQEHDQRGKDGGDLAPESDEMSADEAVSDVPESMRGMDMGQHKLHPGHQKPEMKAHAGHPKLADISSIILGSHHGSHPGTMGQKVHASVQSHMAKMRK